MTTPAVVRDLSYRSPLIWVAIPVCEPPAAWLDIRFLVIFRTIPGILSGPLHYFASGARLLSSGGMFLS